MIPNQTIFVWFNSNSMCATSGAGTVSPFGVFEFTAGFFN